MTIPHWSADRTLGASEALLREYQVQAVNEIIDQFNTGCTNVLLDAPVGSGKTFIAAAVMMLVRDAIPSAKTMYLAGDKMLQRQYHRDFPSSHIIEGHTNYCPYPDDCRERNKSGACPLCGRHTESMVGHLVNAHGLSPTTARDLAPTDCAYAIAKKIAVRNNDVVTNPWYYGREAVHIGDLAGRSIAVYDECDGLDGVIDTITGGSVALSTITKYLDLSPWLMPVESGGEVMQRRRLEDIERSTWVTILSRASAEAERRWKKASPTIPKRDSMLIDSGHLRNVRTAIEEGGSRVAVDYSTKSQSLDVIDINPGEFGAESLWPTTDYRLFMTGSFGGTDTWAKYMGVMGFGVVTVPHTFPVYLRPVYIEPVGRLIGPWKAHRTDIIELAKRIEAVRRGRTLVLVPSAAQARVLGELIPYAITHDNGTDARNTALETYRATDEAVLITTAWRGLDLKDDECRTLVIAKIPWSPRTDLVRKRQDTFPGWYESEVIKKITQGLGRGVRGPEDWCRHYIFDKLPESISGGMPAWVQESVIH